MIEYELLTDEHPFCKTVIATMSVWRLMSVKEVGNAARDLPCREVQGNSMHLYEADEPECAWSRFARVPRLAATCYLTAWRTPIRFRFEMSPFVPIPRIPRDHLPARFVHELLRLYAREPWSFVGLVDQIRRLKHDEREIYDSKYCSYVYAVYDQADRHVEMLLGRERASEVRSIRRLLNKCESHPWRYRELRGYLQRTKWRKE